MCNSKMLDPLGLFEKPEEIEQQKFKPEKDTTAEQKKVSSQRAAEEQRRKRLTAKGRQSTILTSGQGVTTPANVQRKTLLGE